MMLMLIIFLPFLGGLVSWAATRANERAARFVALAAAAVFLLLAAYAGFGAGSSAAHLWWLECRYEWIPAFNIAFHLGMDGLSFLLVILTGIIGVLSVLASWTTVKQRVGFFHFCLLWSLSALCGVFLAVDLFLFYVFWEMMLIPLFLLIRIWGHERRVFASIKFFIFTQAGGLLLLLGIVGLGLIHYRATGRYSFAPADLQAIVIPAIATGWLMLAFFVAFAVKLPAVPLHSWLADAHTEAPVAGSLILAGLVLKAGAYGMIRFMLPLFPYACAAFAPVAMALGVVGILYGAVMAFAQSNLKRLIAYTSISHMGFVLLGIFSMNEFGLQGAVIMIVAHAIAAAALFLIAEMIHSRFGTRDLSKLGGLWADMPRMGGVMMFFAMASLGLPGLAGFVAEFLVLVGAWQVSPVLAAFASGGLVLSAVYALNMVQQVFLGSRTGKSGATGLSPLEWGMTGSMLLLTLWIGLFPQLLLDTAHASLQRILDRTADVPAREVQP